MIDSIQTRMEAADKLTQELLMVVTDPGAVQDEDRRRLDASIRKLHLIIAHIEASLQPAGEQVSVILEYRRKIAELTESIQNVENILGSGAGRASPAPHVAEAQEYVNAWKSQGMEVGALHHWPGGSDPADIAVKRRRNNF